MDYKLISLLILLNLFTIPIFSQISGPSPTPSDAAPEIAVLPDPYHTEDDDYFAKFQELITEFDTSMQSMNPDDIITFSLKQGAEEVNFYRRNPNFFKFF